ncbi:MAG: hemolysin family protein [Thermoanaerobaculia bacterium]
MNELTLPAALAWAAPLLLAALPVLAVLTALIERSGPIRMRHWVEEAGGRLRTLYAEPRRFEAFRYLLNLVAKLAPLVLFLALVAVLERFQVESRFLPALLAVALAMALSELLSRSFLGRDAERALRRFTWAYRVALAVLMPLVLLLTPIVPRRPPHGGGEAEKDEDEASEEEIEAFIDVGTREGILEPDERDLVWGVVDFGDTQVKSVMTPRVDLVCAPAGSSLDELADLFVGSSHSRLPLYRESIDQVVGVLHLRDLLAGLRADPRPTAESLVQPPFFVPETKPLGDLLREFQARRQQMAIVLDEYGGTAGLVTVEDLVEEIVGEINDEHDESEPENQVLPDGSLLVDGRVHVETLDEVFGFSMEDGLSETVGGLVSSLLGYVPKAGESVVHDGLRFTVERADDRRILALRVRRDAGGKEADRGESR